MAEKRGVRARLFGGKTDRNENQRRRQRERENEEQSRVDKKSLFKRAMKSDDGKKKSDPRSREEQERQRQKESLLHYGARVADSYEIHSDPKKREAEAKRRFEQGETADRRHGGKEKKPGKIQSAMKIGKFLHKHSK